RLVRVIALLVTHTQASILMHPTQRPLHNPAMLAQATSMFSATLCQDGAGMSLAKFATVRLRVVRPIALRLLETPARPARFAPDRRHTVHQRQQLRDIVTVGTGQFHRHRCPVGVREQVMFRSALSPIRRIGAGFCPPKTARTEAESTTA